MSLNPQLAELLEQTEIGRKSGRGELSMVKTTPYGIWVVREVPPGQGEYSFEHLVDDAAFVLGSMYLDITLTKKDTAVIDRGLWSTKAVQALTQAGLIQPVGEERVYRSTRVMNLE